MINTTICSFLLYPTGWLHFGAYYNHYLFLHKIVR